MQEFEADVRAGLMKSGQKELYSKYFYDDLGTALFEAITLLPEYGLTRADQRLLRDHARDLPEYIRQLSIVAELGSGSGEKALKILPHLARETEVAYYPIDVSAAALKRCQRDVAHVPHIRTVPVEDSYISGLTSVSKLRRPGTSMIVLFLGSSIGNFETAVAEEFLLTISHSLQPGDLLLLSTDLVKELDRMLAAYDDSLGVTAAFNLNLLGRVNRELRANFNLKRFRHEARYNESEQRVEMHLRSTARQTITINGNFTVVLEEDETIWTESSYKFRTEQIRAMSERAGFSCAAQWLDAEWPFAQNVLVRK